MDAQERIQRFRTMTEADPDNELGHFSLGKALAEEGDLKGAEASLRRVLELNADYSKAYQILGEVQLQQDRRGDAVETLRRGVTVADQRGDLMPRDAMAGKLSELDEEVPEFTKKAAAPTATAAGSDLQCSRCGRPSPRMENRPFKGELGEKVWANVCEPCWREWVGVGTKVINEMGLQLADPRAQQVYDEHMLEYLQIEA